MGLFCFYVKRVLGSRSRNTPSRLRNTHAAFQPVWPESRMGIAQAGSIVLKNR